MSNSRFQDHLSNTSLDGERPNPNKRNIFVHRLSRAPWWLLILLTGVLLFVIGVSESNTYQNAWREVQQGIWTTIWVTLFAYALALVLGLVLALLRSPSQSLAYNILVYQPTTAFVEFIRGIPTLVMVFYITLGLIPELVKASNALGAWMLENDTNFQGIADYLVAYNVRDFPNPTRAIVALAVSYAAFLSEIFRAGIESVDLGQREAAASLGMTRWQIMRHVILPQAIRNILPPLGNDFIAMLKESSLVSVVGVPDITRRGQSFSAATFTFFQSFTIVALTYLVLTLTLSMIIKTMEWYLGRGRQRDE